MNKKMQLIRFPYFMHEHHIEKMSKEKERTNKTQTPRSNCVSSLKCQCHIIHACESSKKKIFFFSCSFVFSGSQNCSLRKQLPLVFPPVLSQKVALQIY